MSDDTCRRFDVIPAGDGRTDRLTSVSYGDARRWY